MFNNAIAKALQAVATALDKYVAVRREELAWTKAHAITKRDLEVTKNEIVKAFGERVDPVSVSDLSQEAGNLEKAVADSKTIFGQ